MSTQPYSFPLNLDPEVERICTELWNFGYSRVGRIFTDDEAGFLKDLFGEMMNDYRPWSERWDKYGATQYFLPPFGDSDQVMLSNIAGRNREADHLLEKLFINQHVKESLGIILGEHYKIWELSARRSNAIDRGLRLHQDAFGEFGISVLLNDQYDAYGTTSLVPKSHRFGISCRASGAEDYLRPSFMKPFCDALVGSAGDVYFFFKKTWHGRVQSKNRDSSECLLFGIFPSGYLFKPFEIPTDSMQSLPHELKRLLRTDEGFTKEADGYYRVQGPDGDDRMIDMIYNSDYVIDSLWKYSVFIRPAIDRARSMYLRARAVARNFASKCPLN